MCRGGAGAEGVQRWCIEYVVKVQVQRFRGAEVLKRFR